jgi:hypothetical protein
MFLLSRFLIPVDAMSHGKPSFPAWRFVMYRCIRTMRLIIRHCIVAWHPALCQVCVSIIVSLL